MDGDYIYRQIYRLFQRVYPLVLSIIQRASSNSTLKTAMTNSANQRCTVRTQSTKLLFVLLQCCFEPTETVRTTGNRQRRTSTTTFTLGSWALNHEARYKNPVYKCVTLLASGKMFEAKSPWTWTARAQGNTWEWGGGGGGGGVRKS